VRFAVAVYWSGAQRFFHYLNPGASSADATSLATADRATLSRLTLPPPPRLKQVA
jgi:hypothetical protein